MRLPYKRNTFFFDIVLQVCYTRHLYLTHQFP